MKNSKQVIALFLFVTIAGCNCLLASPKGDRFWKDLSDSIKCEPGPLDADEACNIFVAEAGARCYGFHDFLPNQDRSKVLTADEIFSFLENDSSTAPYRWPYDEQKFHWKKIGSLSDVPSLSQAQVLANSGWFVIAAAPHPKNNAHGHVALVLPGEMTLSATWGTIAPNSASAFLKSTKLEAYINKPLSFAFGVKSKADSDGPAYDRRIGAYLYALEQNRMNHQREKPTDPPSSPANASIGISFLP